MEVVGITIKHLEVAFTLTEVEIDRLSLALSRSTVDVGSPEEKEAAQTLAQFAEFLSTMQQKVEEANGTATG